MSYRGIMTLWRRVTFLQHHACTTRWYSICRRRCKNATSCSPQWYLLSWSKYVFQDSCSTFFSTKHVDAPTDSPPAPPAPTPMHSSRHADIMERVISNYYYFQSGTVLLMLGSYHSPALSIFHRRSLRQSFNAYSFNIAGRTYLSLPRATESGIFPSAAVVPTFNPSHLRDFPFSLTRSGERFVKGEPYYPADLIN